MKSRMIRPFSPISRHVEKETDPKHEDEADDDRSKEEEEEEEAHVVADVPLQAHL